MDNRLGLELSVGGSKVKTLVDTGAMIYVMDLSFYRQLKAINSSLRLFRLPKGLSFSAVNSSTVKMLGYNYFLWKGKCADFMSHQIWGQSIGTY